jgi:hypothetical protein
MTEETSNELVAISFLERLYPDGPWALTAIPTDRKATETRTFYPKDVAELEDWLKSFNGKWNLYFHVNPVRQAVYKKAERTDIESVCYLHIDIDPRADLPLEDERKRCLQLLTTHRPKGIPEPTLIISSGGGFQGFWKLTTPIAINGELGLAEDAKRYNQQLETVFAGDNCHNIDRLMRLPGTWNVPDAKKLKKGREKKLAAILQFKEELQYDLNLFTAAPMVKLNDEVFSGSTIYEQARVKISGNVARINDLEELAEWNVPDRIRVVIAQGYDPEHPKQGDNSRSAWLFDVVCNLVRFGVPDEVIYSLITDPDWGISASVLELQGKADAYAVRQIEQAKEQAVDPTLRQLNGRYAVISNFAGKCRIVERIEDPVVKRSRITKQSFEDFRNAYMNKLVQAGVDAKGNPKFIPMGQWWLQHPQRRQYSTLLFAPGKESKDGYNLWQGFAVCSKPGDCSMFLDHLRRNICNGNSQHYEYLMSWMARAVQEPASPGEVGIALRGAMGVGKSMLARMFGHLWGPHYMVVSNSSHLVGNFNAHLRDVCFLFADEAFFAGDKKHRSVLRSLITDQFITLEAKGVDVDMVPNYLHIMMASNDRHMLPAGEDERRWLVLDVHKGNHQDSRFFKAIVDQMESGGYEALLYTLLTRDLTNFNVRDVPKTEALQEQKLLSLEPFEQWWYAKLCDGLVLQEHQAWKCEVLKDALIHDFTEDMKQWNMQRRGNRVQLGKFLSHVVPTLRTAQISCSTKIHIGNGIIVDDEPKRRYHYILPDLEQCRKFWEERYGATSWPEPVTEEKPREERLPF